MSMAKRCITVKGPRGESWLVVGTEDQATAEASVARHVKRRDEQRRSMGAIVGQPERTFDCGGVSVRQMAGDEAWAADAVFVDGTAELVEERLDAPTPQYAPALVADEMHGWPKGGVPGYGGC
jgi:hypothetical protein